MMRPCRPARRRFRAAALALLLIPVLAVGAVGGEPARFVAGLEDMPLMPGLSALQDAGLVFDTPRGRIVQVFATGPVTGAAILAFYTETLPQLGWRRAQEGSWLRDGEALRLEIVEGTGKGDHGPIVRFALSPH